MNELSNYYVNDLGSICITVTKPSIIKDISGISRPRLFKVIGFDSLGLLKHKEII